MFRNESQFRQADFEIVMVMFVLEADLFCSPRSGKDFLNNRSGGCTFQRERNASFMTSKTPECLIFSTRNQGAGKKIA